MKLKTNTPTVSRSFFSNVGIWEKDNFPLPVYLCIHPPIYRGRSGYRCICLAAASSKRTYLGRRRVKQILGVYTTFCFLMTYHIIHCGSKNGVKPWQKDDYLEAWQQPSTNSPSCDIGNKLRLWFASEKRSPSGRCTRWRPRRHTADPTVGE